MTDRVKGLYVALDKDYRDDDVQALVDAIKMLRGVAAVATKVAQVDDYFNRVQIRYDIQSKLFDAISDIVTPKGKS